MKLSEQLANATKIAIAPGQRVVVVAEDGSRVVEGFVIDVDPERGLVRVQCQSTNYGVGNVINVDVDTTKYTLLVHPPDEMIPRYGAQRTRYIRPSTPGVFTANVLA
jgi:hypothetical protein